MAPSTSAGSAGQQSGGALEDVVVLDLTRMLAGLFATMMLADQGARVIKTEPRGGDATRLFGPFIAGQTYQSCENYLSQ